jgi:N-acetylmuramoyl-L-alanine amidase
MSASRRLRPGLAILLSLMVAVAALCCPGSAKASGGSDSLGANGLANDWYFAEGTTRADFTTYVAVMNPNGAPSDVTFTYMLASGTPVSAVHTVPASSRFTVDISSDVGAGQDVSTFLHSDLPVVAERPMYFDYQRRWDGGHDSLGATRLASDWYFAEGTTRGEFTTYLAVANPATAATEVSFTYMLASGPPVTVSHSVAARSRYTLDISSDVGTGQDVSTFLHSDLPVVAERPMYFDYHGRWDGGHDSLGANALNTDWYFAEGTTRDDFTTYVTLMNPAATAADVTFTYVLASGPPITVRHTATPKSRFTLDVSSDVGTGQDVSTFLHSDLPVVAERPMYFDYHGRWDGGHDSLGANALNTDWYFAEGTTRDDFTTYLAVMNPATAAARVTFTYMLASGPPVSFVHSVAARSRFTLDVSSDVGAGQDVSTFIRSDLPVVAERPMYFRMPDRWVVCLDAGHSGRTGSEIDPATGLNVGDNTGAAGELESNWDLALRTRARLEQEGYEVKLTKDSAYAYASLRTRADIGNTCDIMVRLHFDDTGFIGVMRPPPNAARCPVSDPGRITVVGPAVAAGSDELAGFLAPYLGLAVRDDTGGTTQGNSTPPGHPTCLVGSVLSLVPIVTIENKPELVRDSPDGRELVAAQLVQGIDAYFAGK